MFDNKIASIDRYERFIERVKKSGEVWGLKDSDDWCVSDSNNQVNIKVMPFWSDRAYAQQCVKEQWAHYKPTAINLTQFVERWLPGLAKDGLLVGTNWNAHLIGEEVNPLELKEMLEKF